MPGYAGGTAATDVARLRLYVAEPGTANVWEDSALVSVIARYPLPDSSGEWPYLTSGSANTAWTPTYDLASAAADVWSAKAAEVVGSFDFTADGATFHKSQVVEQYERQARIWRSRRTPGNHEMVSYPSITVQDVWIGNLAEED